MKFNEPFNNQRNTFNRKVDLFPLKTSIQEVRVHKETTNSTASIKNQEEQGNIKSENVNAHSNGKFQTSLLLVILFFCAISMWLVKANALHKAELQKGIAQDIIRFHVIANSDSSEDQALKLLVKDAVVTSLQPILKDITTLEEAEDILSEELLAIKELAEDTVRQNGYSYPVAVTLEECYFPMKVYGDYTFPPGNYDALRVQIGEAEGKNWWCVMFPPLCFVDETYSIVDESSGEKLKVLLTEEEYNTLINTKTPVKVKFKLWEAIKKLFES